MEENDFEVFFDLQCQKVSEGFDHTGPYHFEALRLDQLVQDAQ